MTAILNKGLLTHPLFNSNTTNLYISGGFFFFFSVISIPASFKITGDGAIWEGPAEKVGFCL